MKTKIYALLLGMLCLCTMASSQTVSPALSGFNGKIQFQGFANNGLFIRGTLGEFLDQTNQYFASDIDTNDVAWDNLGRKYRVVAVISSNLTQAVVDMARVGGGTHFPSGVGMVNRETANGLSLVATANSIGISQQLLSRILTNNFEVMGGLKTIYTGSDSIRVPNLLVGMASDGSQNFALGYFPNFPDRDYMPYEYGIYLSPNYYEEFTFAYGKVYHSMYGQNGTFAITSTNENGSTTGSFEFSGDLKRLAWYTKYSNDPDFMGILFDSLGYRFHGNSSKDYFLPNPNISSPNYIIAGAQSDLIFDGYNGKFIQMKYGVFSSTTNLSGDIEIIIPEMPDNSYSCLITVEGTTSYTVSVHSKTTTSFKIRFFNPATGAAITSTSVSCSYKIEDY